MYKHHLEADANFFWATNASLWHTLAIYMQNLCTVTYQIFWLNVFSILNAIPWKHLFGIKKSKSSYSKSIHLSSHRVHVNCLKFLELIFVIPVIPQLPESIFLNFRAKLWLSSSHANTVSQELADNKGLNYNSGSSCTRFLLASLFWHCW